MANETEKAREDFHSVNNLLNKITTQCGMAKFQLEKEGFDVEKLEQERAKYIELLSNMEEYAMKIGDILKVLRKSIVKPL